MNYRKMFPFGLLVTIIINDFSFLSFLNRLYCSAFVVFLTVVPLYHSPRSNFQPHINQSQCWTHMPPEPFHWNRQIQQNSCSLSYDNPAFEESSPESTSFTFASKKFHQWNGQISGTSKQPCFLLENQPISSFDFHVAGLSHARFIQCY